jgi:hypothetical protein
MRTISVIAMCAVLLGCVESEFQLAPGSRLPNWFRLPANVNRDDVTLTLTYYTSGPAKFKLVDRRGRVLESVESETCWHPDTLRKRNAYGGWNPDTYPHYVYFKHNGVLELLEHRGEPQFWISDDANLRRIAAELATCLSSSGAA